MNATANRSKLAPALLAAVAAIASLVFAVASLLFAAAPASAADPNAAPGGPILVVSGDSNEFGRYYAEILRNEGLNEFDLTDLGDVTQPMLDSHDVVVLGETPLTPAEAIQLADWVQAGGNLIAMRPDDDLAGLLGLTDSGTTLADGYLEVDDSAPPGEGIVGEPIQYHGAADRYSLSGATEIATLYSDATTPTTSPAVTNRSVGPNGGEAAAFTYDLARSVVYTRQGNPAWAGQDRDGIGPIRSNDLFYGNAAGDPQPDWVDLDKVEIPQADEQQRLLANLIGHMNRDRSPLPRFWYFPDGHKAAIVMTGDDHANGGTAGRFSAEQAQSDPGCSVADWECVRSTSYIYPGTPLTDAQAGAFEADGFEVALHPDTGCASLSAAAYDGVLTSQLNTFAANFPSVPDPETNRNHCIAWTDWAEVPKVEADHGIRLDANYYYWPESWLQDRAGMFTGSGMPMRFADTDGSMVDVYQAATQMTDESGQEFPATSNALLDKALGPEGYYGAFTANMHTDFAFHPGWSAIVASAQSRDVPIVSARQLLRWTDARNESSFGGIDWSAGVLSFDVTPGNGANGLQGMVPVESTAGELVGVERNGNPVTTTTETIKGVDYAFFAATAGSYEATYEPPPPPDPEVSDSSAADFNGGTHAGTHVTDENGGEVILKPEIAEEFSGSGLPASFGYSGNWAPGGSQTVSGGSLSVDGGYAGTTNLYGSGRSLEFVATFPASPFTHIGFGVDYNNDPSWMMFSVKGDGNLYARTNPGSVETALPSSLLGSPHRYRIEWGASDVKYYVDGALVATHPVSFGATQLRPLASEFNAGGAPLSVDWLRMTPYASSGTFESRVLDAGDAVEWGALTWTSDEPAGTAVALSVRTGDTPAPDGTWSAWTPVASSGDDVPGNSRYAQYRAEFTTSDPESTAVLSDVTLAYNANPVAVDDAEAVDEDSGASAFDVRANDTDSDGGTKTVESVTQPSNGTAAITNGGDDLTYEPDPDYCNTDASGPDSGPDDTFTYALNGGSTATVSVEVTCLPDGGPTGDADFTPAPGSPHPAGTNPRLVGVGDFDEDGKRDLAVANMGSSNVTILLGDGTGDFSPAPGSPVAVGVNAASLAVADFDGDDDDDLAIADFGANQVAVLLGDGTGGFSPAPGSPHAAGSNPVSITAADFDGDGNRDLAVANYASGDVTLLLGDGNGDFSPAPGSPHAAGANPISIASGDFDEDGNRDLAVANSGSGNVSVLLGDGAGGFAPAPGSPKAAGSTPFGLAVGSFDGDGNQDLAIVNRGSNNVTILLGDGTGDFAASPTGPESVGNEPTTVAGADFDGDGNQDLAVTNWGSNNVTILLGDGAGDFAAPATSPEAAGTNPEHVAAGDFDGDGLPDLAVANWTSGDVTVLLNETAPVPPADTTDPEIEIRDPYEAGRYSIEADPKPELHADYECTDDDSGVASCVGTVADGAPFDRSSPGTMTFTVTATDHAGNTATKSVTYRVFHFRDFMLDDDPIAYYRMGDPAGSQTMHAEVGPDGEYKNGQSSGPFGISGDGDRARLFTGADGYGYANNITAPRSYTLSAFFNLDDSGNAMILQHGSAGAIWHSGGMVRFRPVDWLGVELDTGPGSVTPGVWHQVAATYRWVPDPNNPQLGTGTARLYLDGEHMDVRTADKQTSGTSTFYVGYGDKAPWLRGLVDEVAYYPTALSHTHLHEIWLADPPPPAEQPDGGSGSDGTGGGGSGNPAPQSGSGTGSGATGGAGDTGSSETELPGEGGSDSGDAGSPEAGGIELGTASTAGKWLSVKVSCGSDCEGTLSARKGKTKLGSADFDVAAGESDLVQLKLSKKGRKAVKKGGSITVTIAGADGEQTKTVQLRR